MNELFYTANDLARILGSSVPTAYKMIREMNQELKEQGYYVVNGKIPKELFYEKYPHLPKEEVEKALNSRRATK